MTWTKYNMKDDAQGNLSVSITSSTTSVVLDSGDGNEFPAAPFIWTLTQIDGNGNIVKKEKVKVTAKSWDVFTVVRWFDWSTATSFSNWDYFSLFVTSLPLSEMQQWITDVENAKLNKAGGLRTWMGANKLVRTNAWGAETTLSAGTASQYLKWDFTRWTPPLDVNGQGTITSINKAADYMPIYDASAGTTKKILLNTLAPDSTTALKGLAERATDAEASAGTDTTRYITAKQLKDKVVWATPDASTTVKWLVERATDAEATTGTDTTRYVTPKQLKDRILALAPSESNATQTSAGLVERTTNAEALAGTDTTRYMAPNQIKAYYETKCNVVQWSVTFNDIAQSNITISHWLGRPPRWAICTMWWGAGGDKHWGQLSITWSTIKQECWDYDDDIFRDHFMIWSPPANSDMGRWTVIAASSTTITLSYDYAGSYSSFTAPYSILFFA